MVTIASKRAPAKLRCSGPSAVPILDPNSEIVPRERGSTVAFHNHFGRLPDAGLAIGATLLVHETPQLLAPFS